MNFLLSWVLYAVCSYLFISLADTTVHRMRGVRLPVPSEKKPETTFALVMLALLIWPLVLGMWCWAAWHGKTLGQYLSDR